MRIVAVTTILAASLSLTVPAMAGSGCDWSKTSASAKARTPVVEETAAASPAEPAKAADVILAAKKSEAGVPAAVE